MEGMGATMLKGPRGNTKIIHYSIPKHTQNYTATHHLKHSIQTHTLTHTCTLCHADGRGFAAQRKDAVLAGRAEVERGIFSGEREISSMQFATVSIHVDILAVLHSCMIQLWYPTMQYSHKAIQHLAFIAHGMVAGKDLLLP